MTQGGAERQWITRPAYAAIGALWALFVAYGSLVPFAFQSISFAEALSRFSGTLAGPVFIDSRTDFVTNILLTVPLGYFVMAALRTDGRSRAAGLLAALAAIPACWLFSVAVEFAQVFFPVRTDSLSDIVAQAGGTLVGVALWLAAGETVTGWLRESLLERERPALVQRLLLAYCILFIITQVMPLDLTLSLGQLARKFRNGRIVLIPFSYPYATTFDRFWDYVGDAVVNAPIGAAATLLWTHGRSRRGYLRAMLLAVFAIGCIELAQVCVNSRIADVTDVITGSIGAAFGILVVSLFSDREVAGPGRRRARDVAVLAPYARAGVVLWIMLLASYHWNPYNFTPNPERVRVGMHELFSVPFSSYYLGTEFHALTEMLRKFLLALPLGILLRLSVPRGSTRPRQRLIAALVAVSGFAILFGIELGQVFLPTRVADLTDVIVAEAGLLLGAWMTARLASLEGRWEGREAAKQREGLTPEIQRQTLRSD